MQLITLKYDSIIIGDRFRKAYKNIESLKNSILDIGFISTLAVQDIGSDKYSLLAGGRRMKAINMMRTIDKIDPDIPVRVYENEGEYKSDLHRRKVEQDENLQRDDLSWQEAINLKNEVYRLQVELHGIKIGKGNQYSAEISGISKADIATMFHESPSTTRQDIALAEAIELIPQLGKCKTKDEAAKILKRMSQDMQRQQIADKLKDQRSKTPTDRVRKRLIDSFIIGNFLKHIKDVKERSVDIVEIDPPYAIDLKGKKKEVGGKTVTRNYNEIDAKKYLSFMQNVLNESYRVMRKNSWLILWFGPEPWFEPMYNAILIAGKPDKMHIGDWMKSGEGLQCKRIPGIWAKGTGQTMQPDYYMGNTYEMFFYARKGRPSLYKQGRGNIFDFKPIPPLQKPHPTTRPVELMQEILSTFVQLGSRVLVPFLGSGYTLLAANNLLMEGYGYELSQEYKDSYTIKVYEDLPQHYRS